MAKMLANSLSMRNSKKMNTQNDDFWLQYYSQLAEDFRMRHTAIWTEVKHYSWVLSLLLGAGPAVSMGKDTPLPVRDLISIMILPFLGLFMASIAYRIIKRDFEYYSIADARLLYVEQKLGLTKIRELEDKRFEQANFPNFSINEYVRTNNLSTISAYRLGKIRGLILVNFFVFRIASIFEIAYYTSILIYP